eukprot:7817296-Ditylum_brightwellii.AAC.1
MLDVGYAVGEDLHPDSTGAINQSKSNQHCIKNIPYNNPYQPTGPTYKTHPGPPVLSKASFPVPAPEKNPTPL